MDKQEISRRKLLWQGGAAFAGLALAHSPWIAEAFPSRLSPGRRTAAAAPVSDAITPRGGEHGPA